ncbi:MAG: methyltransferase domain-containing protein [Euryarchaeota archaeon]|nr:methyltransferase domain-containing protein [Euryarchaeota archaeon]
MTSELLSVPGLGPKRVKSLNDNNLDTLEKIKAASFYQLLDVPHIGFKTAWNLKKYLGQGIDCQDMQEFVDDTMIQPLKIENKLVKPWQASKKDGIIQMQPTDFSLESTTVWSFPDRGSWATHTPEYRGNWSPRVVRNVILRYSKEGDTVLDPMVGGGTTLVEAMLTGRNSIGIDVNVNSITIAKNRINFPEDLKNDLPDVTSKVYVGDARNMNLLDDESIHLIAAHPPYANIIKYGERIRGDLSIIPDYLIFAEEMERVAKEMYRVLKPGSYCAILMGDTHNKSHYVPMAFKIMIKFLEVGFILKEDIIKHEWNCWNNAKWKHTANDRFLLTMHEHLFIFRKMSADENPTEYKNSSLDLFREALE